MKRLIELLNEYVGQESYWLDEDSISGEEYINRGSGYQCFINERIISKKFGFIKWLSDHDKLNILALDARIALSEFKDYERVLMALAISDNPIELLISMLKEDKKSDFEDLVDRNIDVAKRLASK